MSDDVIEIELQKRVTLGKGVKHLRSAGKTPAVIHNHGQQSVIVEGDSAMLLKVYKQAGKHHVVEVTADGKTYTTLIKDAEFEPRKHRLNHLVFNAVAADQVVEAQVPIEPKYAEGNDASPAERAGLMVLNNLEAVTVEALPKDIPDILYYDAEKLVEVGDHILISDLNLPGSVSIKEEDGQFIASVFEPSAVAAANDAAGGTAEEEAAVETASEEGEETSEEASTEESQDKPEES